MQGYCCCKDEHSPQILKQVGWLETQEEKLVRVVEGLGWGSLHLVVSLQLDPWQTLQECKHELACRNSG